MDMMDNAKRVAHMPTATIIEAGIRFKIGLKLPTRVHDEAKFIAPHRGYLFIVPDLDAVDRGGKLPPKADVYVRAYRFPEWIVAKQSDRVAFDVEPSKRGADRLEAFNVRLVPRQAA
jgi:hypothetical protein